MKKTVSTATALSTAIVIALGGIALNGQAASAEPAPLDRTATAAPSEVEPEVGGPAVLEGVEDAPAVTPTPEIDDDAEPAGPAVGTGADATTGPSDESGDGSGVTDDGATAPSAQPSAAAPTAAEGAAAPAARFTVASPVDGAVYATLGYELVIEAPDARFSYEVFDSAGQSVRGEADVAGPRAVRYVHLPQDAAPEQSMTVVVSNADGFVLGSETRSFRVEVPTSPAVTIGSPRQGETLRTPATTWPGGGSFVLEGTGQAGSWLHYSYEALSEQTGWGSDYDSPIVRADGTWAIGDGLPYGSWRATVQQYAGAGDPSLGGVQQPSRSRLSAPVTVDFTLAAPVVVAAPSEPVVVPVAVPPAARPSVPMPARVVPVAHRSDLAYTGSSETTPWAGLAGMVLVGLGAATVLVTRRRASRG